MWATQPKRTKKIPPSNKYNVFEMNWSNFDPENFVLDYFDVDWPDILKLDEKNVNSANNFLDATNSVLNKYALLKNVNKYKLILKNKQTWITSDIQKSVYIKNKLLKKFINKKDPQIKAIFYEQYKTYGNLLSTLLKQRKQIYYTKYFENSIYIKNLKLL